MRNRRIRFRQPVHFFSSGEASKESTEDAFFEGQGFSLGRCPWHLMFDVTEGKQAPFGRDQEFVCFGTVIVTRTLALWCKWIRVDRLGTGSIKAKLCEPPNSLLACEGVKAWKRCT